MNGRIGWAVVLLVPGSVAMLSEANAETRAANPRYYWFHAYAGTPRFFWDEIQVPEREFRAYAPRSQIDKLDKRRA